MDIDPVTHVIMLVIGWAAVAAGLFAVFHAVLQRADAFTAADKLNKPKWLGITGAGTLGCALFLFGSGWFILLIAGLVANLVYLVDVRPKVIEVQRGSQW